jgi:hypothetical protein
MLTRSVPKEIPTRTGDLAGIQVQKAARPERHGTGLVCQRAVEKAAARKMTCVLGPSVSVQLWMVMSVPICVLWPPYVAMMDWSPF